MKTQRRIKRNDEMTKRVISSGGDSSAVFWKQVLRRKRVGIDKLKHKGKVVEGAKDIEAALQEHWDEINDPQWGAGSHLVVE